MKGRPQRWPWETLYFKPSEIASIQAVREGSADEFQQREAFRVIVEKIANRGGLSFTAGGTDGQRATDFSEGRRWVGRVLDNIANQDLPFDPRGEPPPMPMGMGPDPPPPDEAGRTFLLLPNAFDEVEEVKNG